MSTKSIRIKGARVHNLKNIEMWRFRVISWSFSRDFPAPESRRSLLTRYTPRGHRRVLSNRCRPMPDSFWGQLDKPDVDFIDGLSPAISIDQKTTSKNPRSTVGRPSRKFTIICVCFMRESEFRIVRFAARKFGKCRRTLLSKRSCRLPRERNSFSSHPR